MSQARVDPGVIDGSGTDLFSAFDATTVDEVFVARSVEGDLDSLGADGIAVVDRRRRGEGLDARRHGPRRRSPSGDTTLVVEAIYSGATDWVGSEFVDLEALRANGGDALDYRVYVSGDEDGDRRRGGRRTPRPTCSTRTGSSASSDGEIDTMLGLFYALLMLAVVIALLGIANTLALSIFERTRELGLLRAVGMARAQVRSTIRWESIIIAVFGTTLGLAIGTFFGWAIVKAMADQGIDTLTIPVGSLAVVTAIAAVAGAVAAVLPARRAAKLDVLHALVSE